MIDPVVEHQYADCRELLNLWRRYHDFFKVGVSGDGISPEKENEFITIKSRIAMLHDTFMDCLDHDQNIGQNILSIVTRSITLKHVHRMSTAEIKKIELEWHESYLLLNEAIGMLDDKRKQFANVTKSTYYRQVYTRKAIKSVREFVTSWVFKTIVVVVVLMVGIFAFLQFGGINLLLGFPATKNLVVKFEDLLRVVMKEYPYRDLESFQRMDKVTPNDINEGKRNCQEQRGYTADVGISRASGKMSGHPNNVSEDLKKYVPPCRTETYVPSISAALGGTECIVWLYRMPNRQLAQTIEAKYTTWKNEQPGVRSADWLLLRKANVIGVIFGGDDGGRIRGWARDQYLRIRR